MTNRSSTPLRASSDNKGKTRPHTLILILVGLTAVFYLPFWVKVRIPSTGIDSGMDIGVPSPESFNTHSYAKGSGRRTNALGPSLLIKDNEKISGQFLELEERIRYLETKLNAYLAFTSDPFLGTKSPAKCKNEKLIKDIACPKNVNCEVDNQMVCLDTFPHLQGVGGKDAPTNSTKQKDCVVYDFGIRKSPEYGLAFSKAPFNCQVAGFDPSPISIEWWKNNEKKNTSRSSRV
jgi:hypothetical protein